MEKKASKKKLTKKSSIIKLSIIGVVLIIGIILSFIQVNIGFTTYNGFARSIKLGLDLKGGVYAVYEMADSSDSENLSSRMDGTRTRLENLLIDKGYTEATVVREGSIRLRVEVPDVDEPEKIFEIIGKPAELKFVMTDTNETVITGSHVLSAVATYDTSSQGYVVSLSLNNEGTAKFREATAAENKGKSISIYMTVDGDETLLSSPTINDQIVDGKAVITGMGTLEQAQTLADQITSGQFEVKLSLLESSTISPTLGAKALTASMIAGAVGLILVMLFMCFFYKMFGAIASFSLMLYTVMMMFLLAIIPGVQLTLPGIAGIVLSIGFAVDANIIVYERIKEEYRNGKSILASYYAGFKRAFWSIFDSNITSIIAGVVLFIFGSGSIKGFAIVLIIGVILSMFTALLVTRSLIKYVMTINSTDEKLYGLKRGAGFEGISADESDPEIEKQMQDEEAQKEKKKNQRVDIQGGLTNEAF